MSEIHEIGIYCTGMIDIRIHAFALGGRTYYCLKQVYDVFIDYFSHTVGSHAKPNTQPDLY